MKKFSLLFGFIICGLFLTTTSCTEEQVMPIPTEYEIGSKISSRADFSGREAQVKVKVAQRDNIPVSSILTCNYTGQTSQGYGRYSFTTNTSMGMYLITSIIGDDIDGI